MCARQSFQPGQQLPVPVDALREVIALARIDIELHDIFVVDTGIDGSQIAQAAREQSRADEQEERERDLRDYEQLVQLQSRAASARSCMVFKEEVRFNRVACHAGVRPNKRPVSAETVSVNPSTRVSSERSSAVSD